MERVFQPGIYRHAKSGNLYRALFVARQSETGEKLVIYIGLYQHPESGWGAVSARPVSMFLDDVEIHGKVAPRFEYVGESEETRTE